MPTPKPISSASRPGTPWSADSFAITIDESTMIAPTERSMPAVRMISVCAMPSVPDDHHLLDDQRQVRRLEEPVGA